MLPGRLSRPQSRSPGSCNVQQLIVTISPHMQALPCLIPLPLHRHPACSSSSSNAYAASARATSCKSPPRTLLVRVARPNAASAGDNADSNAGAATLGWQHISQADSSALQPADRAFGQAAGAEGADDVPSAPRSTSQHLAAPPGDSPAPAAHDAAGSGGDGGSQSGGAAAVQAGGGGGSGAGTVALLTRFNGVGYTFVLAGFLKIIMLGGLMTSAPVDMARTALGKASPYLMVPVGLGLCWVAKQVVDSGLHESKRFLQIMTGVLVVLYLGLVKLLYRYEPRGEMVRRPRPRLPGPLAEMRAELGDKELLAGGADFADSRLYMPERLGKELYDDIAWYEGRYPSQLGATGDKQQQRGSKGRQSAAARLSQRAAAINTDTEGGFSGVLGMNDPSSTRLTAATAAGNGEAPPGMSGQPTAVKGTPRSFLSDSQR